MNKYLVATTMLLLVTNTAMANSKMFFSGLNDNGTLISKSITKLKQTKKILCDATTKKCFDNGRWYVTVTTTSKNLKTQEKFSISCYFKEVEGNPTSSNNIITTSKDYELKKLNYNGIKKSFPDVVMNGKASNQKDWTNLTLNALYQAVCYKDYNTFIWPAYSIENEDGEG